MTKNQDTKDTNLRNLIKVGVRKHSSTKARQERRDNSRANYDAEKPKTFRVTAKEFFITWSQCPAPRQIGLDAMLAKGDAIWAKVAQEHHKDGNVHLHGIVHYEDKKNFKDCRAFDIIWDGKTYHPLYEAAASAQAVVNYHFKEDEDLLTFGKQSFVQQIIGMKREAAIDYCVKNKISKQWYDEAMRCKPDVYTINGPQDIHVKARIKHTTLQTVQHEELKSVLICGSHSLGKTTCAKRLGPYPMLWVRHTDGLKRFIPGFHKSMLFDDMSFDHMPRQAQLHLVDERDLNELHFRYSTATVPAGVKRIFTCNFEGYPLLQGDSAIDARVNKIMIYGDPDMTDEEVETYNDSWR